jgi:hypothetical protein
LKLMKTALIILKKLYGESRKKLLYESVLTPPANPFHKSGTFKAVTKRVVWAVLIGGGKPGKGRSPLMGRARDRSGILFCRRQKRYKRIARSLHRRDAPVSVWRCHITFSLQHRPEGTDAPVSALLYNPFLINAFCGQRNLDKSC